MNKYKYIQIETEKLSDLNGKEPFIQEGKKFVSGGHFCNIFFYFLLNQEKYTYKLFVADRVYT